MCGIAGIFCNSKSTLNASHRCVLDKALKKLYNRGPDAQGTCQNNGFMFGHTRLAIIDIANGQQPVVDDVTGCVLTYNGEIYNYRDLREQLISQGFKFRTNCDTEVVLASYLAWGDACFKQFNGFFALGIADPRDRKIYLARDRVGIKPLYYTYDSGIGCFGSTIPAVATLARKVCQYDLPVMSHYLTTGRTTLGDRTLIRHIRALQPGTWKCFDLQSGETQTKRYWQVPVVPEDQKREILFADAVQECRALLDDAIRLRLNSDVPLGAFISGGLDSAIIARVATSHLSSRIPLFCAGTNDNSLNEFDYADLMAASLGTSAERKIITAEEFGSNWPKLIANKGLPLSTPNEVSIFKLAEALKQHCTVTLTGEGADEIFGGYVQPHFGAYDYDRTVRNPTDIDESDPFTWAMIMKYGRAFFMNDTDHFLTTCRWMGLCEKSQFFKPEIWDVLEDDDEMISFYEDFFERLSGCTTFDKRLHLHANFNLENLLSRVDSSTMYASVEARVPFTDYRLIEFAFSLPDSYKMNWVDEDAFEKGKTLVVERIDEQSLLETKKLPRHAYCEKLPDEVVERRKMSFPVPFDGWFSSSLNNYLREVCSNSELSMALFNQQMINTMLDVGDKNLWLVANLFLWWDQIEALNREIHHDNNAQIHVGEPALADA